MKQYHLMLEHRRLVKYNGEPAYRVKIAGLERLLPIVSIGRVKVNGAEYMAYIASDSELVLGDVEFINAASRELARLIERYSPSVIVTPEAKSIALAYGVARELNLPRFVVARKGVKAYMSGYMQVEVNSITTRGRQLLILDSQSVTQVAGRDVCVVDDVVSTGGTIKALEELMRMAGANVVCRAVVWVEGPWVDERDYVHLGELPVFIE